MPGWIHTDSRQLTTRASATPCSIQPFTVEADLDRLDHVFDEPVPAWSMYATLLLLTAAVTCSVAGFGRRVRLARTGMVAAAAAHAHSVVSSNTSRPAHER
jgi:hypothetical protein